MTEIKLLKKEIEFLLRSRESLWEFCKVLRESNHSMVDAVKEEREACAEFAQNLSKAGYSPEDIAKAIMERGKE